MPNDSWVLNINFPILPGSISDYESDTNYHVYII